MKSNRFYLVLESLGAALLLTFLAVAEASYAQESVHVHVLKQPPPPTLWIVNETYGPDISIFPAAFLTKKTGTVASFGLSANNGRMSALNFDSSGDFWFSVCSLTGNAGYLADFTPRALRRLATNGSANYVTVIEDPNKTGNPKYLSCPLGLVFDPMGNLWVEVNPTGSELLPTLLEYKSSQLTSGRPTPSAVIEMPTATSEPVDLAFDSAGNLWQAAGGTVFEFTAAQLAAGVQADPNQTLDISEVSPGLSSPQAITFDAHGNLWVAFGLGGTADNVGGLEMFAATDLGTASPAPTITINANTVVARVSRLKSYTFESFNRPSALAFDGAGDLWVGNSLRPAFGLGDGSLVEFTPAQLGASGNPMPTRAVLANRRDTNLGSPHYMTFGPALP